MSDEISFREIFDKAVSYLDDSISVIPVRDKEEIIDGKVHGKKRPFAKWNWKAWQSKRMTKEQLWFEMEKLNTSAVATICGAISGNLEVIDIDVKFKPGIDKTLFKHILEIDPILLKKLRINRTPSGGWHILYRIADGTVPGNMKLASREATEDELKDKPEEKVKCYLETRGEHGYVVAPPSLGYKIMQDNPIPVITWEERMTLINACLMLSEIIKPEKVMNVTKSESDYYEVNPFEDYNKRDGEKALLECGWTFYRQTSIGILYTRPGSKSGGEHAVFFTDSKLYFFFTTNTTLDTGKCYNPSTVLAALKYNNDKKVLRRVLVSQGYGKIRPEKEKSIVRNLAAAGVETLPENASDEAKETFKQIKEIYQSTLKFWTLVERSGIMKPEIDREEFYYVAAQLGYRLHQGDLVQIVGNLIYRREERLFYDEMKATIKEIDETLFREIQNEYEHFIQKNGEFSIGRIMLLEQEIILSDDKTTCYKFYADGYKKIQVDDVTTHTYADQKGLIWAERVQPRNMTDAQPGGKYMEFLQMACDLERFDNYINKIIGYLAHEYKDSSTSYIIILTEQCPDPKMGGGSGKNIFSSLFKLTTTYTNKPGSQTKFDENFLQSWNHQRIFCISDVAKNFDYMFLKEPSSGDGILKKLYKDQVVIECKDMPKFLIQTNYSFEVKDGGLARRIRQIEFTDFFTKCGGVDVHFGGMFPDDWTAEDWAGYDAYIEYCIQAWFKSGMKIEKLELTANGWMKQFDQTYNMQTREFIESHWDELTERGTIGAAEFTELYDKYLRDHGVNIKYRISPGKMNDALADYCGKNGYGFNPNFVVREGLSTKKVKKFTILDAPF